jgi:Glycosyl transferase family 2
MPTLRVLRGLLLMAQLWLAGPILYLSIVSTSAILTTRRRIRASTIPLSLRNSAASSQFNFAILIPAHNEEIMLDTLLDSLSVLDYPKDRYTVYVVADNCTDRTAELARARGWVRVYERHDEAKRGKGHALGWLLQKNTGCPMMPMSSSTPTPSLSQPFCERWLESWRQAPRHCKGVALCGISPNLPARPYDGLPWC